jgi:hypothetical protein
MLGQSFARPDGSIPVPTDWSSKHVIFTGDYNRDQMVKTWNEPRAYAQWIRHGNAPEDSGLLRRPVDRLLRNQSREAFKKDWAISLGAGGVAPGMSPAKFSFDANATPSCTADFVVFPINASTGNTRASVVGTFTGQPRNAQTTAVTVTPTAGSAGTLTLTSSTTTNTGTDFEIAGSTSSTAANLAAAINRNLSTTALDRVVAVASGATVTVYALTPGTRVTLSTTNGLRNFNWAAVTNGLNGSQASLVGVNHLYSGSGASLCNLSNPEFIFSYASGVGPVATSPTISLDGTKIGFVENDPNIGAILHVLTFASGSTEYGTTASCTSNNNGGTTLPTCATSPVIPGSTSGSTAADYMLPLGLVAADATTGTLGATDSFSSPFIDYSNDTIYVGDNNGYLYAITPAFKATPAYEGGNFPVQLGTTPAPVIPTQVTATATTVTVTATNSLSIGEMVTISGVAANTGNGCTTADANAINGMQTVIATGLTGTAFEFNATIGSATTGTGCNTGAATVIPGSNYLASPVVDVGGTGNIFVGDSSSNFYAVTSAGATAATALAIGVSGGTNQGAINGGIRDGVIIDSTNGVGFLEAACSPNTTGEVMTGTAGNAALVQFTFTSSTLAAATPYAGLDTNENENCKAAGFPVYAPMPDERYYALGIGSATAANNGEIIGASSGTGGQQLKDFAFVSSALQTTPNNKPQLGNNASPWSPMTEFFNSQTLSITGITATATTVTVTASNSFAASDLVVISGVAANAGNTCTAGDLAVINGANTVTSATSTSFTFTATVPSATTGSGCTVTGASVSGGLDYLFVAAGSINNQSAVYGLQLLNSFNGVGSNAKPTVGVVSNTTDAVGGTSGMVVDNDSTAAQASSLYFGTLATSTTVCGTAASYCAVKLTQASLQ